MCARIHDAAFYFIDTTTDADMQSVTEASDCSFRRYEGLSLHSLKQQVTLHLQKKIGAEKWKTMTEIWESVFMRRQTLF